MAFTSLFFMFCFLPVSLILLWLARKLAWRNGLLLGLSLVFYSWGSFRDVCLLLVVITFNYLSGLQLAQPELPVKRKKIIFWSAVGLDVSILVFYKYILIIFSAFGLVGQNALIAPLGVSFYVFTIISYLADVYTGRSEATSSWIDLALYTSFFGKVTMGPIAQYHEISSQLDHLVITRSGLVQGINLFLVGLVKKVFFADQLSLLFGALAGDGSFLGSWTAALAYTFQLYFDFSGYSDMAIGVCRMFGLHLPPNFNHPYTAASVQDFWRRWHISLSTWFRNYVYIPLGGSRQGTRIYIRNILIVWGLTGLWHGANWTFIVWGLYYGLLLLGQKFWYGAWLEKQPKWLGRTLTFLAVVIGWVFFFSPTIGSAFGHLGRLFLIDIHSFASSNTLFYLSSYWLVLAGAVLFSGPVYQRLGQWIFYHFKKRAIWPVVVFKILVFGAMVAMVISSSAQTFLYAVF